MKITAQNDALIITLTQAKTKKHHDNNKHPK
jgi:hypothetical protein